MPNSKRYLQAYEDTPGSSPFNPSPISNSTSGQEPLMPSNSTSVKQAIQRMEQKLSENSSTMFLMVRPKLEKLGAVNTQDASASHFQEQLQKTTRYMKRLSNQIRATEIAFAEWINTFESDELALFALEVEKFMILGKDINDSVSSRLEEASKSLDNCIENETIRNVKLSKYSKCKKECNNAKRKSIDENTAIKYDDNVEQSYSAVVSAQTIYENNVKKMVRPKLFGVCNSIRHASLDIQSTVKESALDLVNYEKIHGLRNATTTSQSSLALDLCSQNFSNMKLSQDPLFVRRPNHSTETYLKPFNHAIIQNKKVKSRSKEVNGVSSELESEEEEEEEEEPKNSNSRNDALCQNIYFRHAYDYDQDQNKGKPLYHSPFLNETNVLQEKKMIEKDLYNNEKPPFAQKNVPNDDNNFDTAKNYATYVNDRTNKVKGSRYVAPIMDSSITEMWSS